MNTLRNENCSVVLCELDDAYANQLKLCFRIVDLLKEIGISTQNKGFMYLRDVIIDDEDLDIEEEMLYPKIAEKWRTTALSVKNYMCSAICSAWRNDKQPFIEKLGFSEMPTERELIAMCRLYLQVE